MSGDKDSGYDMYEHNKFKCLKVQSDNHSNICRIYSFHNGKLEDLNFKDLPTYQLKLPKTSAMYGRAKDLSELIGLINNPLNKVITVIGFKGLGKSTLIKCAANFLMERQKF